MALTETTTTPSTAASFLVADLEGDGPVDAPEAKTLNTYLRTLPSAIRWAYRPAENGDTDARTLLTLWVLERGVEIGQVRQRPAAKSPFTIAGIDLDAGTVDCIHAKETADQQTHDIWWLAAAPVVD